MLKDKDVKITYHTIIQRMWRKAGKKPNLTEEEYALAETEEDNEPMTADEALESPFYIIGDVLKFILKLPSKKRFYDIKNSKFCYLDVLQSEVIDANVSIYKCIFESAKNEFRPLLINKKTGAKRKNPKELSEGDIERTHFLVRIDKSQKEVYAFAERNSDGITINNFVNYVKCFSKQYCEKVKLSNRFSIFPMHIPRADFMTELELLERTASADIYFSKQLLGSKYLGFSNRTTSIKEEVMITVKSNIRESIKEFAVDAFNVANVAKSKISRIRIRGIDQNKNEVMLDTMALCKSDYVSVEVNQDTGELNSTQLFTGLLAIANSFA